MTKPASPRRHGGTENRVPEHACIMQGHSVRGILEDRKNQTRRVPTVGNSLVDGVRVRAKFWDNLDFASPHVFVDKGPSPAGNAGPYLHVPDKQNDCRHRVYPLWRVGDRLWVKESWKICDWTEDGWPFVSYKADGARRLCTENISEEWNERLSSIWEDLSFDLAETASDKRWRSVLHMPRWASRLTLEVVEIRAQRVQEINRFEVRREGAQGPNYRASFCKSWDSINAPRGYGWDANPWVWVHTFKVVKARPAREPADSGRSERWMKRRGLSS